MMAGDVTLAGFTFMQDEWECLTEEEHFQLLEPIATCTQQAGEPAYESLEIVIR
jgi:hypothetical protein